MNKNIFNIKTESFSVSGLFWHSFGFGLQSTLFDGRSSGTFEFGFLDSNLQHCTLVFLTSSKVEEMEMMIKLTLVVYP